ncbi:TetR/AcrR family transcriptional regulator [Roseburia hominis]
MKPSTKKSAKTKIQETAWELFLAQGYEETTISQIIERSGTSRSAFYHHFRGKDELLFSVAYTYDLRYQDWVDACPKDLHAVDKLISFNDYIFKALEDSPYRSLYSLLYGLQVSTTGTRHILNPDRQYYQILRSITKEGIEKGEIISPHSYTELSNMISSFQIGTTYSWCLQRGQHSLFQYGKELLTPFLESLRAPR